MGPRNTRKDAKKLGGSHRGHEGHRGNIKVVRTRPAPNFTLSLKIILCDLRDLCVINFPHSECKGWSLRLRPSKARRLPYARHQLAIVAIAEPFPISGLTIS